MNGSKRPARPMVTYRGRRTESGAEVLRVDEQGNATPLNPRNDVIDHSPTGFEWGYGGSGPAQLALALCIDALGGDVARAREVYQDVKWGLLSSLTGDTWELTAVQIRSAVQAIEQYRQPGWTPGQHGKTGGVIY